MTLRSVPTDPDATPSDLVDERTWLGIQQLPDDVSIRTSNEHGRVLKLLHDEWGNWIESTGGPDACDLIFDAMLDAGDELHAATFCTLHGYHRQAIASLRGAIETVTIGAYCQVEGLSQQFHEWQDGLRELSFGRALDALRRSAPGTATDNYLKQRVNDSLFQSKNPTVGGSTRWS